MQLIELYSRQIMPWMTKINDKHSFFIKPREVLHDYQIEYVERSLLILGLMHSQFNGGSTILILSLMQFSTYSQFNRDHGDRDFILPVFQKEMFIMLA